MHSRVDRHRPGRMQRFALVASLLLIWVSPTLAADSASPTEEEVITALDKLKADPNLATERTMRVLRWVDSDSPPPPRQSLEWLRDLLGWIAQTSRVIVWLAVGLLAAALVLLIVRFVNAIGPRAAAHRFEVPTHVRDLDIRPESLPDDVGAAAFALWERGEHRAALSLLYRGLLSRLAHVHALPIRHSTTEGDCMELATHHLRSERSSYVSQLVHVWQQAVYGHHEPQTDDVRELCNGFASALSPAVPAAGAPTP